MNITELKYRSLMRKLRYFPIAFLCFCVGIGLVWLVTPVPLIASVPETAPQSTVESGDVETVIPDTDPEPEQSTNSPDNMITSDETRMSQSCSRTGVQDTERHAFDELTTIRLDANGDGRSDELIPRVFETRGKRGLRHWISFNLRLSGQTSSREFFRYMYGGEDPYWVWALVPCRINRDRYPDLLFYSGDDTSEEEVLLLNTKNSFVVFRRPGPKSLGEL
jgi:hypothetical protein